MSNTTAALCTKNAVTRAEVLAVPAPENTDTWFPLSYAEVLDTVETAMERRGYVKVREQYGLAREGRQFFGALTYDAGRNDAGLAIGVRSSIDKSLAPEIVGGGSVFVCDNLMFNGNDVHVLRKNTRFVARDFKSLVLGALQSVGAVFERMERDVSCMRSIPLSEERGYEVIGRAMGLNVIRPRVAGVAMKDWREHRHDEFSDRTAWSLYNCVTEGLKSVAAGARLDEQTKAHGFFTAVRS